MILNLKGPGWTNQMWFLTQVLSPWGWQHPLGFSRPIADQFATDVTHEWIAGRTGDSELCQDFWAKKKTYPNRFHNWWVSKLEKNKNHLQQTHTYIFGGYIIIDEKLRMFFLQLWKKKIRSSSLGCFIFSCCLLYAPAPMSSGKHFSAESVVQHPLLQLGMSDNEGQHGPTTPHFLLINANNS